MITRIKSYLNHKKRYNIILYISDSLLQLQNYNIFAEYNYNMILKYEKELFRTY